PRRCLDRAADLRREEEDLALALERTWFMPHAGALEALTETEATADGEPAPASAEAPAAGARPAAADATSAETPRLFADASAVLASAPGPVWQVPSAPPDPSVLQFGAAAVEGALGHPEALASRLRTELGRGQTVILAVEGRGSAARIRELLVDEGIALELVDGALTDDRDGGLIVTAALSRGFVSTEMGLTLLSEADVTGRRRAHRKPRAKATRATRAGPVYGDLREGDYVVHYHHGVGRFEGITQRSLGGVEREYLVVAYAGEDKLYVPVDQLDAVRKYVGGDSPRLSRMGGSDWARTKAKVRAAVAEIADELVRLYRERLTSEGHAFAPDADLMAQAVAAFPHVETPDQARAIVEVTSDMEAPVPMDRLVCGDVGYGKTEIAVRAVLKAVADGRQAAVLVPTTVLAQQHFNTFSERFADLPVRVEMMSRFLTAAQQREVAAAIAAGKVDVAVGTHRLLSEDVRFANLGLVVVDEEQRFGVKAKERLKELRTSVDVLAMTATPIPRTLEFALTGIRDMSVVNTAPEDRRPVLTFVGEFDEQAVAAAVRRELLRDGQVFYVHNRVRSIDRAAAQLQELVPEARIGVAHGQMDEGTLERIMLAFWDGEFDVLVSTTIIESGLDIPRANTLIVDRADLLGLAQLYQIRGRVGRAQQRAYAYLFYPPDRVLTEEAHERLKVIAEHTELGSGFAIAMRDLELRGAGNLLGEAQSGHIAAVGFDLYCQLVNEAVAALRGEAVAEHESVRIDLPLEASVPESYVDKEALRLEAYRRLADARTTDEVDDVREEWQDRYGPLPEQVENLIVLATVKVAALGAGVREIVFARGQLRLSPMVPKGSRRMRLQRLHPKAVVKEDQEILVVPYEDPRRAGRGAGARVDADGRAVAEWTRTLLEEIA
ncbi:MAG: transcription-repair coupling factor, partial [Acidimicrobiia bacterium]|nr:transcription-repair coupling factor [Acidimicrobiia bacterium]